MKFNKILCKEKYLSFILESVSTPASTRHGTDVVFMLVGQVEITSGNMWKCLVFSTSEPLT